MKIKQPSPNLQNRLILQRAFERLSSGTRINSAGEDPAGLAIGGRFSSQIRGLGQASRNVNDGISRLQTADGVMAGQTEALQRMRELAVQAGNGILNNSDRRAIQSEMDQLGEQLSQMGDSRFNGQRLFDAQPQQLQVGPNAGDHLQIPGLEMGPDRLGTLAEVTGLEVNLGGLSEGALEINAVEIQAAGGNAEEMAAAINAAQEFTGVSANVEAAELEGEEIGGGSLDAANSLSINGIAIAGEFAADDAGGALISAINEVSERSGVLAERSADGGLHLRATGGENIEIELTGEAAAITGLSAGTQTGRLNLQSDELFSLGGSAPEEAGLNAGVFGQRPERAVLHLDVSSPEGANRAIESLDRALGQVSQHRSRLGALQRNFEHRLGSLAVNMENMSAARSRIMDTDFAEESSRLLQAQIKEQAEVAMLSQANVSGHSALRLLGGA